MKKFSSYLKELQYLNVDNTLIKKGKTVIILSGSSNYKSASLSETQKNFLKIFKEFGYNIINSNFPYNENFEHKKFEKVSILKASVSNIVYYWHTLYNKKFQREIERHLKPLFDLDNVVIITQSSGLNLLKYILKKRDNVLREQNHISKEQNYVLKNRNHILREQSCISEKQNYILRKQNCISKEQNTVLENQNIKEKSFQIFSLGPVAQGYGKIENCIIFKGKKDIYTKILDFHKSDEEVDCEHLNYLENKKIKEFIYEWLEKNKS